MVREAVQQQSESSTKKSDEDGGDVEKKEEDDGDKDEEDVSQKIGALADDMTSDGKYVIKVSIIDTHGV